MPYDPATPTLGTYPKELKAGHLKLVAIHFIAALFTIARRWKQPISKNR